MSDHARAAGMPRLHPKSFQREHVAEDLDEHLAGMVFVLDLQESLPAFRRLQDWAMTAVAPAVGETAVDIGCGTGTEVRRLAKLLGARGRAIGVEPHGGLRAIAAKRANAAGSPAEFIDGDAMALPFEDASVDVIRCERVFQHLPDPAAAAAEMARILRPGGRAVILDSDWGTAVTSPGDPEVVRRLYESSLANLPNPFAGRLLRAHLTAAGLLVAADIGSSAFVLPDEMLSPPLLVRANAEVAVQDGAITAEEARALEEGIVEAVSRGAAFVSVTMFAVVGRRPA